MKLKLPSLKPKAKEATSPSSEDEQQGQQEQSGQPEEEEIDEERERHIKEIYFEAEKRIRRSGIRLSPEDLNERVWDEVDFILEREAKEAKFLEEKNNKKAEKPLSEVLSAKANLLAEQAKAKAKEKLGIKDPDILEQSRYTFLMKENLAKAEAAQLGEEYEVSEYADFPPGTLDENGKPIPFTRNEDGSLSPCEFDEGGAPINPIVNADGSYMYYEPSLAESKGFMDNLRLKFKDWSEKAEPTTLAVRDVAIDISTNIEKVVRGI